MLTSGLNRSVRVLLSVFRSDMLSVAVGNGPDGAVQLHASTVAIDGNAVCITGPSGAGKSGFALALMAYGASLIADDITWLEPGEQRVMARCPPALLGRIEARTVGILNAAPAPPAPVSLIVDLGHTETERLPQQRHIRLFDADIPVLYTPDNPYFPATVWHYVRHGRELDVR